MLLLLMKISHVIVLSLLLLSYCANGAETKRVYRVGITSFRDKALTLKQWSPTMDYLSSKIPGCHFVAIPLNLQELKAALSKGELDFVITNPEHYIVLETDYGVSRAATQVKKENGKYLDQFGGVVFARSDRTDIRQLDDVKGRTIAASDRSSFAGFLLQFDLLKAHGIDIDRDTHVQYLGFPQDLSVKAVLDGHADIGFVRTGVLEAMAKEGRINLSRIRVLNQKPLSDFPFLLSTGLFPEWPLAATPHLSYDIKNQVVAALLMMPPGSPAARSAQYYRWTTPRDYLSVQSIMRRNHVYPFDKRERVTFEEALHEFAIYILSVFLLVTTSFAWLYLRSRRLNIELDNSRQQLILIAHHDELTGLPNRRMLLDRLHLAITGSARSGHAGSLLFIDLDDFKTLNDNLGHALGDKLLAQVAQRLIRCIREADTVARLGGDEFVVILEGLSENLSEAAIQTQNIADKILIEHGQAYQLDGHSYHSSCSIGATLFIGYNESLEGLMKQADMAMYQAKGAGRNLMRFFDPTMQAIVHARAELETDLRQGLKRKEFILYYQSQVDADGRLIGAEALVRWQHPERGVVGPNEFISLAEETGLILPLGRWVLETACAQLVDWASKPEMAHLSLAVNISARQFRQPDFPEQVLAVVDQSGANPMSLKLEITESLLLTNIDEVIEKMTALKAIGIAFAIDDFGTGYSSLAYLKRLPLDQLKIDQSFVRDLLTDPNDAAIARTIIALAHSLDLSVIAEGVENDEQRVFLASIGCFAYQGYLFGRPGPVEGIEQLLN